MTQSDSQTSTSSQDCHVTQSDSQTFTSSQDSEDIADIKSGDIQYVIKKGNVYMCISTSKLKFLDITNYLQPGLSYEKYLLAYGTEGCKLAWPYEWFTDMSKLDTTELPPIEAFFSQLKNESISAEKYAECQALWRDKGMKTMKDFITAYNIADVGPFLDAIEKQVQFFEQFGIDMLKDGISISGITLDVLMKLIPTTDPKPYVTLFNERNAHILHKLKSDLVGGPSIIFHRRHKVNSTCIKGNDTKVCKSIMGYDCNAMYLSGIADYMPCNYAVVRRLEHDFRTEFQSTQFGSMAHEFILFLEKTSPHPTKLKHQFNGREMCFGKRNIPVDCFDTLDRVVYQFHGCYWHGHACHLTKNVDRATLEARQAVTEDIETYLRSCNVKVVIMRECEWEKQTQTDDLARDCAQEIRKSAKYFKIPHKGKITEADILKAVDNDTLFGLVECDLEVPMKLREKGELFYDVPPIFKNAHVSRAELGPCMLKNAQERKLLTSPTRMLISSYFIKQTLIPTPLLKWYMDKGLSVTNVTCVVHYEKRKCFQQFANTVTQFRRAGDGGDKNSQILADTWKLLGNSAYGRTLTRVETHGDFKYVGTDMCKKLILKSNFQSADELEPGLFEVKMGKRNILYNLPVQIGYFVYGYAKLKLLQFMFDCIDRFLVYENYSLILCDTDSLYFSLSTPTLIESVKPELLETFISEYDMWFCVPACRTHMTDFKNALRNRLTFDGSEKCCQKQYTYNKKVPGLFKVEWSSNAPGTSIIALCSKTYICTDGATKHTKRSTKGVNKRLNPYTEEDFSNVLNTGIDCPGVNRGFRVTDEGMFTYEVEKKGGSFFYCKRKVLEDRVSTRPLDI